MVRQSSSPFGQILKSWRRLRGVSQLALATHSGVSARHISFIENGRSRPGRGLVLRLAESLDMPPRERNELLESAGLSPIYEERKLSEDDMLPYRRIVQRLLENHEPFPAIVLDRWWNVVDGNTAAGLLLPEPGKFGFNVVETFLATPHERDDEWIEGAWGFLARLRKDWVASGQDQRLGELMKRVELELKDCERPAADSVKDGPEIASCMMMGETPVSIVATLVRFDTVNDITLNELRVELIFPADEESENVMRTAYDQLQGGR